MHKIATVVLLAALVIPSCQRAAPGETKSTLLEEMVSDARRLALRERCESGKAIANEKSRSVIYPVSACGGTIGDTTFYSFSNVQGELLAVTRRVHVTTDRLASVTDSVYAQLVQRYGEGKPCPPEILGGPYIFRYHRWNDGEYDVQLLSISMDLPGVDPSVSVQVQNVAPVCGQWLREPGV